MKVKSGCVIDGVEVGDLESAKKLKDPPLSYTFFPDTTTLESAKELKDIIQFFSSGRVIGPLESAKELKGKFHAQSPP